MKKIRFVNLTPHALGLANNAPSVDPLPTGDPIPPTTPAARVLTDQDHLTDVPRGVGGYGYVPVMSLPRPARIEDLPEPQEGVRYIVSIMVVQAMVELGIDRDDVFAPDTGPDSVIRDEAGRIVAVRRLIAAKV